MPALPDNNTGVTYVDYSGDFGTRTFQVRHQDSIIPAVAQDAVETLVSSVIANFWYDDVAVTGARYRAKGSTVTLPIPFTTIAGTVVGSQPAVDYPEFLAIQGRGNASGRKVRLSLYGISMTVTDNYRITDGEAAVLAALVDEIRDMAIAGTFCTIAGDTPIIYDYLNTGYNAYHQRRARRTA